MKKIGLLLIGLALTIFANGQIIQVQGGTSISKLDWNLDGFYSDLFSETLIGYSVFTGIDYLDKQYFNLSSNMGVVRKGGKDKIKYADQSGLPVQTLTEKATLDYLSINTTIDFKYRIKETIFPFISFGPRFDYLLNSGKHFDALKKSDILKNTSIGLILGGGLKYNISNLQFGLRADYYLDFTKVANWTTENSENVGKISVNTFTINLSIGYRLK